MMSSPLQIAMTGETDLTFTRDFAAPRPLVWRALTDASLIPQWLYARQAPMTVCNQDFRVGGRFRWVWRLQGGQDMGMGGRFVEISAPARLVHTELFDEDWTGGETLVTTELSEIGTGQTRMVMQVRYSSAEARARAAATPMAEGMQEGYERLDQRLADFAALPA